MKPHSSLGTLNEELNPTSNNYHQGPRRIFSLPYNNRVDNHDVLKEINYFIIIIIIIIIVANYFLLTSY
jgi:hypothetical protein